MNERINGKITLAYWEAGIIISLIGLVFWLVFNFFTQADFANASAIKELNQHQSDDRSNFSNVLIAINTLNSNQLNICEALKIKCQDAAIKINLTK